MRNAHRFFAPIFLIVTLFLAPGVLLADVTGSVTGVVHDRAQAVVVGAKVSIINVQTNLSQQVVDEVRNHFKALVFQTIIPRSVRLGEAPSFGKPIIEYDPNGIGATAYRALAVEFLGRELGHQHLAAPGVAAF